MYVLGNRYKEKARKRATKIELKVSLRLWTLNNQAREGTVLGERAIPCRGLAWTRGRSNAGRHHQLLSVFE